MDGAEKESRAERSPECITFEAQEEEEEGEVEESSWADEATAVR